jgi:hypothetical protein
LLLTGSASRAPGLVVDGTAAELIAAIRTNGVGRVRGLLADTGDAAAQLTIGGGVTPLHVAAALDLTEICELLIAKGADISARTKGGFTPLHWAVSRDAVGSARALVKAGADIEAPTLKGITPLHWAANNNATNAVALMLNLGAKPLVETESGVTPLHWAVMQQSIEAAESLAFRAVTEQMEQENWESTLMDMQAVEEGEEQAADETETEPPPPEQGVPMAHLPRPAFGRSLLVPIGFGERLSFAWIESLGIWFGAHEVTNGQFRRFRPNHKSLFYGSFSLNGNSQPAVYVSWEDAEAFCRWLNKTHRDRIPRGCIFRLPTDREWQIVAQCGDNRSYPWGDRWPPKYGNLSDLTARRSFAKWEGIRHYEDGFAVTCPVYNSGVNEWGIYGLAGNVWEWCEDWYDRKRTYKVRRGGSWDFDGEASLRTTARGFDRPDARYDTIGIRLAVSRRGGPIAERAAPRSRGER